MSYVRAKMINGNGPYYYEVRSEREGENVRQVYIRYLGTSAPVRGADGEWVPTSEIGAGPEPVVPNEEPRYRADADRVNESMNYGLASARFSTDAQDKLGRMTPKERAAVVEELRDKVDSGDMNDHVRYVNRHPEVLDAKPKPGDDVASAEKSIALWKTSRFYPTPVVPKKEKREFIPSAVDLTSPSGRMSERSRKAANERFSRELGLNKAVADAEAERSRPESSDQRRERLHRSADELRGLADRGMKPRAYRKKADELDAEAERSA